MEDAAHVVRAAFLDGAHLIALSEVSRQTMKAIHSQVGLGYVAFRMKVGSSPGSRWDSGVFFREDSLSCRTTGEVYGGDFRSVKAAHNVSVRTTGADATVDAFRLYLVHWRSPLLTDSAEARVAAARALHNKVRDSLAKEYPVVVMGDFNEEPFGESLWELRATRDPLLVQRHPGLMLYNPSWGLTAPRCDWPLSPFGSFAMKQAKRSTRHLYDQALTSMHFLSNTSDGFPAVRFAELAEEDGVALPDLYTHDHSPMELLLP